MAHKKAYSLPPFKEPTKELLRRMRDTARQLGLIPKKKTRNESR